MIIDSFETESSVETEPNELEALQAEVIAKFSEQGINIDRQRLSNLITEIRYGNLNSAESNQSSAEYRPNKIFAEIERNGQVTVDRVEFDRLSERQKLHTILHEAGHRLDWLISSTKNQP